MFGIATFTIIAEAAERLERLTQKTETADIGPGAICARVQRGYRAAPPWDQDAPERGKRPKPPPARGAKRESACSDF